MKDKPAKLWRISPHVSSTIEAEGGLLLDLRKSLCYSLNAEGAAVWLGIEASEAGADLENMVTHLVNRTGVSRSRAEADVESFLRKLRSKGLIRLA
jgi:uncharacterized NAD(P)/FAD-binding protein YdhS